MHYYKFHVSDFNDATRHLTRIERSIYRDLIDLYYQPEEPLPNDLGALCRLVLARTEEEATAVEQVLNEFFTLEGDVWCNSVCDEQVQAYQSMIESKSKAGKKSAKARKAKRSKVSSDSTSVKQVSNTTATQGQLTNNHKPITNNHSNTCALFDSFWALYPRKTGKKEARKAWDKINATTELFAKIQTHIGQQYPDGYDKAFIPHPTTYLNQERWNDEVIARPEAETRIKLPADDQLMTFATSNNLPQANAGESFFDYRRRLQGILDRRGL